MIPLIRKRPLSLGGFRWGQLDPDRVPIPLRGCRSLSHTLTRQRGGSARFPVGKRPLINQKLALNAFLEFRLSVNYIMIVGIGVPMV